MNDDEMELFNNCRYFSLSVGEFIVELTLI